jgi:hypothetical protein
MNSAHAPAVTCITEWLVDFFTVYEISTLNDQPEFIFRLVKGRGWRKLKVEFHNFSRCHPLYRVKVVLGRLGPAQFRIDSAKGNPECGLAYQVPRKAVGSFETDFFSISEFPYSSIQIGIIDSLKADKEAQP